MEALPWDTLGLGGVVVMMIATLWRLLSTGKFVPAEQVDRLIEDRDETIAYLKGALGDRDKTIAELIAQNAKLTVVGDVSMRALQSLPTTAQSGSDHVATPE